MPVQRFRRVQDLPPLPSLPPGRERARLLRVLWGGWSRVLPPLDLRGVRRYRDIEEAARDREAAVIRRARRLYSERGFGDPKPPSGVQADGRKGSAGATSRARRDTP